MSRRRRERGRADGPAPGWVGEHLGALLGIGLSVGGAAAALVLPGAAALNVVVPVIAAVLAVAVLHRRDDPAYLDLVVWLWLLTPWLRRVVDQASSYSEESPILLAAPAASLVALLPALLGRRRIHGDAALLFALALFAFGFAYVGGLMRYGVVPATVGLTTWLSPLAVGLWVATTAIPDALLKRSLLRLATTGALVLGAYGVFQFFFLPEPDALWMRNVELISIGLPLPFEVRVFSTLNSPATLASVLGAFLILLTASRSRLRWPAAALGFACFGLSLVRTAWLGMLVALVALVAGGQSRAVRNALIIIAVPAALLIGVEGPAQDAVTERFSNSVEEGEGDSSVEDRVAFHEEVFPLAIRDALGRGFGSTGSAAQQLTGDAQAVGYVSVDSGLLDLLLSMGSLVGITFFLVLLFAVMRAWGRGRHGDALDQAASAALVALVVQMFLGNMLVSAAGVPFWVLLGLLARRRVQPPREVHGPPGGAARPMRPPAVSSAR